MQDQKDDISQIDTWLIDMDGVLYAKKYLEDDLVLQSRTHYKDYLVHHRIDHLVRADQQTLDTYTLQHGSIYIALRDLHNIDPQDMVDTIHDKVDISRVPRCPTLAAQLNRLPGRKILCTSSPGRFSLRMTDHLGVTNCFAGRIALEDADFFWKHRPEPFLAAIKKYGFNPKRTRFIDDTHTNHAQAHILGMQTNHLHYGELPRTEDYIHRSFPTIHHLLHEYVGPPLLAPAMLIRSHRPALSR